jgi:molybdopterin molybdotransferase
VSARGAGTGFERRTADWIGVREAQDRILAAARSLDPEEVSPIEAEGRVLTSPLVAGTAMPPWDNSAMDGYAVRAADVQDATADAPVTLKVTGRIYAGDTHPHDVAEGEAVRIMTGAPLPPGADAVVRVEDTDAESAERDRVRVQTSVASGRYVRPAGQDFRAGDQVLPAGRVVTPGVIALAAASGRRGLSVPRRPRVALLATGDELRPVERYADVVAGRGIPESNTPMLSAMIREAGGMVGEVGIAPDDPAALEAHILRASADDVLVTIGGASMGEADLVKRVLDGMGFEQDFWRVRLRPGSPFSFGFLQREGRRQPVFGLPGNPSSAFVTFEIFVRPFLRRLGGHAACFRPTVRVVAGEDLRGPEGLAAYLRVRIDRDADPAVVRLTGPQGSGLVRGLAMADGLAILPEGVSVIERGDPVDVLLLQGNGERGA